jgi:hypothetical protein
MSVWLIEPETRTAACARDLSKTDALKSAGAVAGDFFSFV